MGWRAGKRLVLAGLIAVIGMLDWVVIERYALPGPDQALVGAMLPVIDERLELGSWRGALATARPDLHPRWFCAERVIEIRHTGDELAVGLDVLCQEYARSGEILLTGSGEHGPKLAVVSGGPDGHAVRRIDSAPDGDAHLRWVERTFSPAGAAELRRRQLSPRLDDSAAEQARQAFGLPADAPVELYQS